MTGRERIAEMRTQAATRKARTDKAVSLTLPLVSMAILACFAEALTVVVPSFLPAHPGFGACYLVLLAAYWTIRMAGAS
jgi:hypothetical protein